MPSAKSGQEIYKQNHCAACHSIGGKGGCLAPPLDNTAAQRGKDFILARITKSKSAIRKFSQIYKAQELMPHPRLDPALANEIAKYLAEIPKNNLEPKALDHKVQSELTVDARHLSTEQTRKNGMKLFYSKGCMECHSVRGTGGTFAVALDGLAKRRDHKFVQSRISNAELLLLGVGGEYQEKGTNMPPSNLTPDEIMSITDFLMSLPDRK